jgi:hypothetical protein
MLYKQRHCDDVKSIYITNGSTTYKMYIKFDTNFFMFLILFFRKLQMFK